MMRELSMDTIFILVRLDDERAYRLWLTITMTRWSTYRVEGARSNRRGDLFVPR